LYLNSQLTLFSISTSNLLLFIDSLLTSPHDKAQRFFSLFLAVG
jgi:hypothetical protein